MITKEEQKTYLMLLEMDATINTEITKKLTKKAKLQLALMKFYSDGFTDYEEKNEGWFYRSFELLKEETGINSNHTISANIKLFKKLGLLEVKQEYITRNGKGAKVNYYRFADKKTALTRNQNCTDITTMNTNVLQQNCTDMKNQNCTDIKNEIALTKNAPTSDFVTTLKNNELQENCTDMKNQNCTIDIDIEKDKEKESLISNSLIDVTSENNLKDLNCFVLSFLGCSSRAEGIELYKEFTKTHKLQDDEMEFLATYTSKVGEVKGWTKQTTTNNTSTVETDELNVNVNTSSTEEETRFTTPVSTSSFKTPSELDFLGDFDEEVEEVTTHTENDAKTNVSSSEEKKYTVDWSVNLNTAKCYFKQTAYRYAKQWMNLSDEEREKRFVSVVESGFPESTFAPFERYIKGIVMEKLNEFATIVKEEASKFQDAVQNGNPTTSLDDDAEYFSDVVDNYAVENEKSSETTINEQMEQASAYIYNLLGW